MSEDSPFPGSVKEIAKKLLQVIFRNELVHFTLLKLTTKYAVAECLKRRFHFDFIYMSKESPNIPQS